MPAVWAGIDSGKRTHHCVVIDQSGLVLLSRRVTNDEAELLELIGATRGKHPQVIADQARMRTDLQPVRGADQISVDLRMLTSRRTDLICGRVRAINRLRGTLLEYFPALERAFDYSKSKAALTLLSEYQTPDRLRR